MLPTLQAVFLKTHKPALAHRVMIAMLLGGALLFGFCAGIMKEYSRQLFDRNEVP